MNRFESIRALAGSSALALLLWIPAVSPAAAGETLTLEGAIAAARARARLVTAAEARRVAQEARLREARAHRLPRVSLSEVWIRTDSPAEVFALELNQERFSFADFVASDPNDPDPLSSATTRLELELPVYTGGELSARIQQAELAASAAREGVVRTSDEAALAAAEAFIQLAQAREQVALLERSLANVDAHVELARSYVRQGMLVSSELLRAEVERSGVADLLSAARGHAEVAEAALSFRLATDLSTQWELSPLPAPQALETGLDDWLEHAAHRADLAAARSLERAAALEVEVRKAARRPQVGLNARYDLVDDQPLGTHGDSAALIAMASIDLFTGGRHRAAVEAAAGEAEAVTADVDRLEAAVRLQIRQAFEEAQSALERHATAGGAVEAALETERILEERFRQGIVRTIDLLDAATARREAETRELVARADSHLARLRLVTAAGRRPESAIPSLSRESNDPTGTPEP